MQGVVDGPRFDAIARTVARTRSRRQLIAGLLGGALGLAGLGRTDAVVCREPGRSCRGDADCCSHDCGPVDATGRRVCRCRTGRDCPPAAVCPAVACQGGACVAGVISGEPCRLPGGGAGTCHGTTCVAPTTTTTSTTTSTTSTTTTGTTSTTTSTTTGEPTSTTTPPGCTPNPAATTCAGKCGTVTNNCGQGVDCTAHCRGCCNGGTCESGTTDAACGSGGHACVACSTSDLVCGGHCSANFHICSYPGSHTSCGHTTCRNGSVTYAGACDGQGTCVPGATFGCSPWCNGTGTACLDTCGFDTDCVSGYYCNGIQCAPGQANGATCNRGTQCKSGNCVDNTCCASASCGPCESCAAATGICHGTCSSSQTCCQGACKTQMGYSCSQDSDCCVANNVACALGFAPVGGTGPGICCTYDIVVCAGPNGFCCQALNGCFVAGTRVAMADGTTKAIEDVAVDDQVLGRDGINRVLAVIPTTLGRRPLYGFNGGGAFVTAGHPFLTEGGWKAVDPAAVEAPGLAVGRLAVGDRMLALAGVASSVAAGAALGDAAVAVEVKAVTLHRLTAHGADPMTPLYNLVVDGDHTYIAGDFLVHNK